MTITGHEGYSMKGWLCGFLFLRVRNILPE